MGSLILSGHTTTWVMFAINAYIDNLLLSGMI
jgi:hypothetical protein